MPRHDDRSENHLKWLVDNRSANQNATLELFVIIEQHESIFNRKPAYARILQELAGIAFSLWRAVFLSDLRGEIDDQIVDVKLFLGNLISNNSIGYAQDRAAREWTFQYYLTDAGFRLMALAAKYPAIVTLSEIAPPTESEKEDWEMMQRALGQAIRRFSNVLAAEI